MSPLGALRVVATDLSPTKDTGSYQSGFQQKVAWSCHF